MIARRASRILLLLVVSSHACGTSSDEVAEQRLHLQVGDVAAEDVGVPAEIQFFDAPVPVILGAAMLDELGPEVAIDDQEAADLDGDGVTADLDCDDSDAAVSPSAIEEFCNRRDENCNGVDECDQDRDGAHDAYDLNPLDPAVGGPDHATGATPSD